MNDDFATFATSYQLLCYELEVGWVRLNGICLIMIFSFEGMMKWTSKKKYLFKMYWQHSAIPKYRKNANKSRNSIKSRIFGVW